MRAVPGAERDRGALTSGARRVDAAIVSAAADRASDLKIVTGGDDCRVRARIAGRDVETGPPWTVGEGLDALRHVFNARDGRSGHLDIVDYAFQSFSVTPGGVHMSAHDHVETGGCCLRFGVRRYRRRLEAGFRSFS